MTISEKAQGIRLAIEAHRRIEKATGKTFNNLTMVIIDKGFYNDKPIIDFVVAVFDCDEFENKIYVPIPSALLEDADFDAFEYVIVYIADALKSREIASN